MNVNLQELKIGYHMQWDRKVKNELEILELFKKQKRNYK